MVRPKKHLGQHFLKEPVIAKRIADALSGHGGYQQVLEIGPGTGALTQHLLDKPYDLRCIELDAESVEFLHMHYAKLDVIEGDLLKMDRSELFSAPTAVIGNFPYNISTQIIFKVLENKDLIPEVVGMFQKEVADRIAEIPGSKTYGITSVLTQAFYKVEKLFNVEPGSFVPPPKVRSSVIRLQRNNVVKLDCDEQLFTRVVKAGFNQRRKTLSNALKAGFEFPDGLPDEYGKARAEKLSVADFVAITKLARPIPT
jgi:16S rRNA (adenine1518-N6/adenine1519-N6)-dimethyltransferase